MHLTNATNNDGPDPVYTVECPECGTDLEIPDAGSMSMGDEMECAECSATLAVCSTEPLMVQSVVDEDEDADDGDVPEYPDEDDDADDDDEDDESDEDSDDDDEDDEDDDDEDDV